MIDAEPDLGVCGEASGAPDALVAIRELRPDAVIVDLSLECGDGLELVREARIEHPELPLLVLSMYDETIYAERLLAAGATGYIMKQAASDQLLVALRRVLTGRIYLSEALAARSLSRAVAGAMDPIHRLSNRELQVLNLIGRGVSSRNAAAELGLSVKTIESHRQSIKHKLNLETNAQLLQYAMRWFTGQMRPTG